MFCSQDEAPDEVLRSVDVPDVNSIHFHPLTPFSNFYEDQTLITTDLAINKIPIAFKLDDIETKFANV